MRKQLFLGLACALASCGYGSVNPILSDADVQYDAALLGTWQDSTNGESAVITRDGPTGYSVLYKDEDGRSGSFQAKLGRIASFRALDLKPVRVAEDRNDLYRSLLLPLHALVIVDSIGTTVQFRLLNADSVKSYLGQHPQEARHVVLDDGVLLTGPTTEVRHVLATILGQEGALGDLTVWRRVNP